MIVLDTNVVSEIMRRVPSGAVVAWLDNQARGDLYLCAPVLAEIRYGIARLEETERKQLLRDSYQQLVAEKFEGRILPFDSRAAEAYGDLVGKLETAGKAIDVFDAMIAAVALVNSATLATRSLAHFAHTGLALVDPFNASP